MVIIIHIGPAAIAVNGGWVGAASGDRRCANIRASAAEALADARSLDKPE